MLILEQKSYQKGSVLMNAPKRDKMDELAEQDTEPWWAMTLGIGSGT